MSTEAPHVVYLLTEYPVLSQTFVRNEIQALRETGARVTVLTLREGDTTKVDRTWAGPYEVLPFHSWPRAFGDLLWWAFRHPLRLTRLIAVLVGLRGRGYKDALRRLPAPLRALAQQEVRAVHCHFGWSATAPTLYAGVLLNSPSSVTLHADDIYAPSPDLGRKLRRFDRLVTVCQYNVSVVRALVGRSVDVSVVPCGVSVPSGTAPAAGRQRVLSVGRLVPKKGFPDLVAAMDIVREQCPQVELDIIGDGPGRVELEAQIARGKSAGHIRLRSGLPNSKVLDAMTDCSVFALACRVGQDGRSDALPVVIREAMARARPVVSTDVAGIPETLEGAGWVVPSRDIRLLADALIEALTDRELAAARGEAARRRTLERFTLSHTAAGMRTVLSLDHPQR